MEGPQVTQESTAGETGGVSPTAEQVTSIVPELSENKAIKHRNLYIVQPEEGEPVVQDHLWGEEHFFIQGGFLNGMRGTYYGRSITTGYPTFSLRNLANERVPVDLQGERFDKLDKSLDNPLDWKLAEKQRRVLAKYPLWGHSIDSQPIPGSADENFRDRAKDIIRIFQFGLWPAKSQKVPWSSDFGTEAVQVSGFQAGNKFDGLAVAMREGTGLITNENHEGFVPPKELLFILPTSESAQLFREFVGSYTDSVFNGTKYMHKQRLGLNNSFLDERIVSIEDEEFEEKVANFSRGTVKV